jgi:hypothetical protein
MANKPAVPAAPANPEPAAPASPPASTAAAAPAAPAAAAGAPDSTPPAEPSLLAGADAGKHEGAAAATDAKPPAEGKPADQASAAKPADGTPPPEGAKKDDAKPADGVKPDAAAKPDGAPDAAAKDALAPEVPPAPPTYGDLKLPDGFKLDDTKLKDFDSLLGAFETGAKAEHGQVEALRQNLVDFYHAEVQRIGEQVARHQVDVWNRMKEGWINNLKADPELGGNRIDTTLGNAKYAYENYLGLNKQQQDELMTVLDNAGVSSHPLLVRGLHGLYQRFREPEPVPPNPPIPPAKGKEPGQRGWYDDGPIPRPTA